MQKQQQQQHKPEMISQTVVIDPTPSDFTLNNREKVKSLLPQLSNHSMIDIVTIQQLDTPNLSINQNNFSKSPPNQLDNNNGLKPPLSKNNAKPSAEKNLIQT